jgi:hypothetical protein
MTLHSRFLCFLLCFALSSTLKSQEMTDFGLPTSEEMAMTVCPFDPDADAAILKHEAHSFYNDHITSSLTSLQTENPERAWKGSCREGHFLY